MDETTTSGDTARRRVGVANMVATAAVLLLLLGIYWRTTATPAVAPPLTNAARPEQPLPTAPISLEGSAIQGTESAKAVLLIVSDFQCPFCGVFARDIYPKLRHYVADGKLRIAFRHMPLVTIHPFALRAAASAVCAGDQGRFWEMHDLLFQDQAHLDDAALTRRAVRLGLDASAFGACLDGEAMARVRADARKVGPLKVGGTPTFFLGSSLDDGTLHVTRRLSGALPATEFEAAIDKVLGDNARQ